MKNKNKHDCPICLGAKIYFTGSTYKNCNLCDDDGKVSESVHEFYEGEDDVI